MRKPRRSGWGWRAVLPVLMAFACEKTGDCPIQDPAAGEVADAGTDGAKTDAEVATTEVRDREAGGVGDVALADGEADGVGDVALADGEAGDLPPLSACQKCIAPGMCFRFDKIEVTEPSVPEGLPAFLNSIWTPDVQAYRLNILLCIDDVTAKPDGTLSLAVTAGAAWHDLPFDQVLPVQHSNKPSLFEFVEGFTTTFTAEVAADCTFRTVGPADLWFHPGPVDHALVCSAGDPGIGLPVDTIPIEALVAHGSFDNTCTRITSGKLEGCIANAAACQICSFMLAPDYKEWNKEPDTTITNAEPCKSSYCNRHCGYASGQVLLPKGSPIWANFGGFVQGLGVPLTCDTDGDGSADGYGLAGNWEAGRISYKGQ